MEKHRTRLSPVPALAAGLALVAGSAWAAAPPAVEAGRGVAQRGCGGCHAVGDGPSPLADAPPFRMLQRRYPPGGLAQLLDEGMLPPSRPPEEGRPAAHPRMPMVALDPDEVANLTAFLRSLEQEGPGPAQPQ